MKRRKEFPGSLVVRTQHFHCQGPSSVPGWENKILQTAPWSQKKKNAEKEKNSYCNCNYLTMIPIGHHRNILCCYCYVTSVVSDSVRPYGPKPTRLPLPWDSPGKNTGMGCHFLLQCMKVKSEKWKWSCSVVSDLATPWTAAYQAPPSMGFSRQEYCSGVPLPSPEIFSRQNK